MEQYKLRRIVAASTLGVLGGIGLTGCSETLDYDGYGQEFIVRGTVSEAEDDGTIKIHQDDLTVITSSGKSKEWFPEHEGQDMFSENFNFHQKFSQEPGGWFSCGDDVYVGEVIDASGNELSPQVLKPGTEVEIDGKIRESIYYQSSGKSGYCNDKDRAVYDTIRVLE